MTLIEAVVQGDIDTLRSLLVAGAEVDERNEYGHTALMEAASKARADIVRLLLEAGADPRKEGSLALDFAVRLGNLECVKLLLATGADANCDREDERLSEDDRMEEDEDAEEADPPPLFDAVQRGNLEMVRVLLAAGADPSRVAEGFGILAAAVCQSAPSFFEVLLEAGGSRQGALRMAAQEGKSRFVERLLAMGADLEDVGDDGMTPLALAAYYGHAKVVKRLLAAGARLDSRDEYGKTPLGMAVQQGKTGAVRLLLEAGASVDGADNDELLLHSAMWSGRPRLVELILKHGGDPNADTETEPAALFQAVAADSKPLVETLLAAHADPNVRIRSVSQQADTTRPLRPGATPLMLAAREGAKDLVERLLAAGADPRTHDDQEKSAVDYAASAGHLKIVERIESAGGSSAISTAERQTAALLRSLKDEEPAAALAALEAGADPHAKDQHQVSALTLASEKGAEDVVKELLERGADPNHVSENGLSPLRVSAIRNHVRIVRYLLAAGANPNAGYDSGSVPADERDTVFFSYDTVLHDVAAYGCLETAEHLLAVGADLNAVACDNLTPVMVAVNHRQMALAKMLLAAGATIRPGDELWLSPYFFAQAAEKPEFQRFSEEVSAVCGVPAENVPHLPGVRAYRFTPEEREDARGEPADAVEAGRRWGERFCDEVNQLDGGVGAVLEQLAQRARAAGFLLLDGGIPRGCGPLVQYVVLLPTSDRFAAMVAFGVRGNDQELSTRDIVRWFRDLDQVEPFELRGVKFDVVDIEFKRPVADPERMARRMADFCHDLVGSEPDEIGRLTDYLRNQRRVRFWWD